MCKPKKEALKRSSPPNPQKELLLLTPQLWTPASRTVRQQSSAVQATQFTICCYRSPWKLFQISFKFRYHFQLSIFRKLLDFSEPQSSCLRRVEVPSSGYSFGFDERVKWIYSGNSMHINSVSLLFHFPCQLNLISSQNINPSP